MKALAGLALAVTALAADAPRIIYTRSFPGSNPAYFSVTVERSGAVSYKEAVDDDPEQFQLEESATSDVFELARRLDNFKRPVESGLKVANMGVKTFRWENGADASETKFNYSQDLDAQLLQDIFERISESERLFAAFKRAVRHDKLGVHQALLDIENSWRGKRLIATQQFLPLLDQVAKTETFMHIARERAAQLAEAIRGAKPKA